MSSTRDLARAGYGILSSRLSPSVTRRWFAPVADTSNLRNGVGRPWEIYHAPAVDVLLKAGDVGPYSSYLGLSPDMGVGFAILAHDATGAGRPADLNVHADIVAETLADIFGLAAQQAAGRYGGVFAGKGGDKVKFRIAKDGPGLVVSKLVVGGKDVREETARVARIEIESLDFRLYPAIELKGGGRGPKTSTSLLPCIRT